MALLAVVFATLPVDSFLLDDFDKGIKEYVIDKERQKEILIDFKASKKIIKTFNKQRKSDYGDFEKMNADRNTTEDDFFEFYQGIKSIRDSMQSEIIDARIAIASKLSSSEWDSIVAFSIRSSDMALEKAEKKAHKKSSKKSKNKFDNIRAAILETEMDSEKQMDIITRLEGLILKFNELNVSLQTMNENEHIAIKSKETSKTDFLKIVEERNKDRILGYKEIVGFHMAVKENTNPEEWKLIMKEFNKKLELTNH